MTPTLTPTRSYPQGRGGRSDGLEGSAARTGDRLPILSHPGEVQGDSALDVWRATCGRSESEGVAGSGGMRVGGGSPAFMIISDRPYTLPQGRQIG